MRTLTRIGTVALFGLTVVVLELRADEKEIPIDKVPKPVMKAVKDKFPKAVIKAAIEDTENGKTEYEIETTVDGTATDLVLKPDGTILAIEKEIKEKDLPAAVAAAVKAKYPKAKVTKTEELTKGTTIQYEVVVEEGGKKVEVVLEKTGKIVE
jgi:hypothetical protein